MCIHYYVCTYSMDVRRCHQHVDYNYFLYVPRVFQVSVEYKALMALKGSKE